MVSICLVRGSMAQRDQRRVKQGMPRDAAHGRCHPPNKYPAGIAICNSVLMHTVVVSRRRAGSKYVSRTW
jgi:hypothetical protein